MDLTDINKDIRFINKIMGKGREKNQETGLSRVDIFKWLLRKKVDKANIYSNETRGKRKSRETHPSRVEILKWLLRNGINKKKQH